MKKVIIPLFIAFALIMIALSCKKNPGDSSSWNYQSNQLSNISQNVENRILSFKANIERPLKTGYSYPIDTAVRYIEALLNYTYGDVTNNLQGISLDSIFVEAILQNGKMTPYEVNSTYNKIIDSLTIQYQNLPSQNLHLVFADVFRRDSISGSVVLGVTSVFAYGSIFYIDHFGEDDYWMYGFRDMNAGGYCDGPYQGNNTNEDAASRIRDQIRMGMGVLPARHYTMDIVKAVIFWDNVLILTSPIQPFDYEFINPKDEVPGDNMYDYLILEKWSDIIPFDTCLIPNEMNFYYDGAKQILYDEVYTATEGTLGARVLIHMDMKGDHNSYYFHPHVIWHELHAFYGVIIYNPEDPEIFD
jgi:hypothetical protein